MTSGERMVWAAEFVRARAAGRPLDEAAESASNAVESLRLARTARITGLRDTQAAARLDDMLSNGGDR